MSGWRILHVSGGFSVALERQRIRVFKISSQTVTHMPLEEIASVIFLGGSTVSTDVLAALLASDVCLVFCGKDFLPCGMALGLGQRFESAGRIFDQIGLADERKRFIWRRIVISKIRGQSRVLKGLGYEWEDLANMTLQVRLGDGRSHEARAAKVYWSRLLAGAGRRDDSVKENAFLNYGYAIVRSVLCRALVGSGFLTAIGVHHISRKNYFNLADDLLEIYRPLVDYAVFSSLDFLNSLDDRDVKVFLRRLPFCSISYGPDIETVQVSCRHLVRALSSIFIGSDQFHCPVFDPDVFDSGFRRSL